ncbi:NAD(P)-dependent oxidoreductase [Mesorhizobium sp.]|uniref:NAD(P)-dependent oxidoreductase n=1 Tax=Mesorhizobium sp. TaxID=1871066 RepID=UPI000FE723E5|nr:NAD(P)-dependent oxidoreductase [Mesorhizobium sp.]RWL45108.1 MAG: NAD(P)-dependent oxidoreductase [Mesorhizobium sp.]
MPAKIGFIGLGNMGRPMAANLARKGATLVVRDADAGRQEGFVREFAVADGSKANAFADVEVVVTMLPNGKIVRQALLDSGIADALPRGSLVIDTSSAEPLLTRQLAEELAHYHIGVVDAPVSGGTPKAIDGTLSIMLGADDEELAARAATVLSLMSARIFRTGALGTGHAMKALNNYVLGAGFVAAAEAYVVGEKFGLDPKLIVDVLNASSGRNVSTEAVFVSEVVTRRFRANFTFGLISKDVGIAAELADRLSIETPLLDQVHRALSDGGKELGMGADYSELVRIFERRADITHA